MLRTYYQQNKHLVNDIIDTVELCRPFSTLSQIHSFQKSSEMFLHQDLIPDAFGGAWLSLLMSIVAGISDVLIAFDS